MPNTPAPIETKVVASTGTGSLLGLVTWMLVTFIPSWHTGIPPQLATILPFVVGAISSGVAGYLAKHTPRQDEALKAAFQILSDPQLADEIEALMRKPSAPATPLPTTGIHAE